MTRDAVSKMIGKRETYNEMSAIEKCIFTTYEDGLKQTANEAAEELAALRKRTKKSVVMRDEALTKRNQELRHLRKLVGELKKGKADKHSV